MSDLFWLFSLKSFIKVFSLLFYNNLLNNNMGDKLLLNFGAKFV